MADEARCTPLHPENMDATCSDVRELLAPTSFHVVHGGCASVLNVDKALIGQLSPLGKLSPTMESQRERENFGCLREGGSMTADRCTGVMVRGRRVDTMCVWLIDSMSVE